jgi:DNA polymerase-3 subunit epsilon
MQQSLFALAVEEKPVVKGGWETILSGLIPDTVFTVIDTETTGLNPKKNDLIEITAIQYKNGEPSQKFSTLIKPFEPISEESSRIHGITDDMVTNAPALMNVLTDLCGFVGPNPIIVGHNVSFDIGFIREKMQTVQLASFLDRFSLEKSLCTRVLAKKMLPGLPSYEGVQLAGHLGITNLNAHRAEADVIMAAEILFGLLKRQETPLTTLQELLDFQGPLS